MNLLLDQIYLEIAKPPFFLLLSLLIYLSTLLPRGIGNSSRGRKILLTMSNSANLTHVFKSSCLHEVMLHWSNRGESKSHFHKNGLKWLLTNIFIVSLNWLLANIFLKFHIICENIFHLWLYICLWICICYNVYWPYLILAGNFRKLMKSRKMYNWESVANKI